MPTGNTSNDIPNIPPIFGNPKEIAIVEPSLVTSNMWLIRIDDNSNELEKLQIQTVPNELNINPEANWSVIPSLGRNNPFYHYTGGEDILEFELDWYSVNELKDDVIRKCRWVESLSRADAYRQEPSRVVLIFGELFRYTTWIVKAAPYTLSRFNKEKGMLPTQAYQQLTLAKVTRDNSTILDRRSIN